MRRLKLRLLLLLSKLQRGPSAPLLTMKRYLALLLASAFLVFGCGKRLERGGAYSPTNTVGGVQADFPFFAVDSAYNLAYATVDAAFKFERENRQLLWDISPTIKRTLDEVRPQAVEADKLYIRAREVYKQNPVPANLAVLQSILSKIQQLAATAQATIPRQP